MNKSMLKTIGGLIYPILIVTGAVIGPAGLLLDAPLAAGIGNAMFLAGIFTPMILLKQIALKDAAVGGVWLATVLYFWHEGEVSGAALLATIPLLIVSILLTRITGVKLTPKPQN